MCTIFVSFPGDGKIDESKMSEIASKVCESVFSSEAMSQGAVSCIKNTVNELSSNIANVAQNIQDIDTPLLAKPEEPKVNSSPGPFLRRSEFFDIIVFWI